MSEREKDRKRKGKKKGGGDKPDVRSAIKRKDVQQNCKNVMQVEVKGKGKKEKRKGLKGGSIRMDYMAWHGIAEKTTK
jgi:hypothetical protein